MQQQLIQSLQKPAVAATAVPTTAACLKIVFPPNPDSQNQTGDKSDRDDDGAVIQVFLPRPAAAQRSTSERTTKPNRKQKRNLKLADQQQQFSYSVEYFTWTLSDEEEEDSDDCQSVTIPLLNRLRISNSNANKSSSKKESKS